MEFIAYTKNFARNEIKHFDVIGINNCSLW